MDAAEFANLQESLMWVLGPAMLWLLVLMLVTTFFAAITTAWFPLLRRMLRRTL